MPDITMCMNDHCPRREQCYRYTAEPNPYRQSYAQFEADGCREFVSNALQPGDDE